MVLSLIFVSLTVSPKNSYSFINIVGLAIGIAISILIFLFVQYEFSYDEFYKNSDRIFRIAVDARVGNTEIHQTGTPAPMPAAMYKDLPEIERENWMQWRAGIWRTILNISVSSYKFIPFLKIKYVLDLERESAQKFQILKDTYEMNHPNFSLVALDNRKLISGLMSILGIKLDS